MAEVEVAGVGRDQGSEEPILLLRERGGQRRYVAIWVGPAEATAVAAGAAGAVTPRPLTHRLLLDVVEAFGATLERVEVTALVRDQFHAELTLQVPGRGEVAVSARASDAIALGVHRGCRIEVSEAVLAEAALPPGAVAVSGAEGAGGPVPVDPPDLEAEIERLREDLAEATPDDFRGDDSRDDDPPEGGAERDR